jgi:hypothetical protein
MEGTVTLIVQNLQPGNPKPSGELPDCLTVNPFTGTGDRAFALLLTPSSHFEGRFIRDFPPT